MLIFVLFFRASGGGVYYWGFLWVGEPAKLKWRKMQKNAKKKKKKKKKGSTNFPFFFVFFLIFLKSGRVLNKRAGTLIMSVGVLPFFGAKSL